MTGQELFDRAIQLCGFGGADTEMPTDISDLKLRALPLINLVLAENSILDSRIRKSEHRVLSITEMSEELHCSEIVAQSVLPYGLAMLLLLGEDDALAAEFSRLYSSSREEALKFGKARILPITEVYG